jgi:glycosyltransferase involved in cell wall biosynthesis
MTAEGLCWWTYFTLGPLVWAGFAFGLANGKSKMRILVRPPAPLPEPPPSVSILIPARDEADQIEKCVSSVLQQDYRNFRLIVADHCSTDGTGEILDRIAAKDSHLHVVHIKEDLPSGWGGKSFALHKALEHADGDWLLFVDADVQLNPDVLTATIARANHRGYDLISLLPTFVSGSFAESVLQPLAGAATTVMFAVSWTNSDKRPTAFANGQYLCVKRSAYEAIGGHEAIRGTLSEDVALARKLKAAGFKPRLGFGDTWATVRMYQGFKAIFRGWSRNFYVGSLGKPWRILGLVTFLLLAVYSIFPALGWGVHRMDVPGVISATRWFWAVGAHAMLMIGCVALIYVWASEKAWNAILFPFSCLVMLAICAKSLWICKTGRVSWRGQQYTRDHLPGQ